MIGWAGIETLRVPTFDSPKVAKARLPIQLWLQVMDEETTFFVPGGDILDDRLVTFLTIGRNMFID